MTMVEKPFAPACERNKAPILEQLRQHLPGRADVLEIGSGTGQHAAHFAAQLPHLRWQCSDVADNLAGIARWIDDSELPNLPPPLALDVLAQPWPLRQADAVFSANTAHILCWDAVVAMFAGVRALLAAGSPWLLYGPFNQNGQFTSEGNQALDQWARQTFPGGGLRDIEAMVELGRASDLLLSDDIAMPANNRLLYFRRAA